MSQTYAGGNLTHPPNWGRTGKQAPEKVFRPEHAHHMPAPKRLQPKHVAQTLRSSARLQPFQRALIIYSSECMHAVTSAA
jgi:hypothetical protein